MPCAPTAKKHRRWPHPHFHFCHLFFYIHCYWYFQFHVHVHLYLVFHHYFFVRFQSHIIGRPNCCMWRPAYRNEKFKCAAPRNKPVLFELKPMSKKVTLCQPSWHGAGSCVSQVRKEQHCPERFVTDFAGNTGYMVRENYHKVLFFFDGV